MTVDLESEIRQNTRDINTLSQQVIKVVTMVENSERRHDSEVKTIDEIFLQIKQINEKVSATVNMKDDIASLREDVRIARHDVNSLIHSMQGVSVLGEKVTELKADCNEKFASIKSDSSDKYSLAMLQIATERKRIDDIVTRNAGIDGGVRVFTGGAKILWLVFGGIITSVGLWVFTSYFQVQVGTVTQTYQSKKVISGE